VLSQRAWRKAGAVTIAACAILAWVGSESHFFLGSPVICVFYWGAFLALLGATFYIVWLDLRFIRLQYAIQRRALFHQTLGDEELRKGILDANPNPTQPKKPL
jgi:hypothetical protein